MAFKNTLNIPAIARARPDVFETRRYSETLNMNARNAPKSILIIEAPAMCHEGASHSCRETANWGPVNGIGDQMQINV